jgi:putative transcriptional regulator
VLNHRSVKDKASNLEVLCQSDLGLQSAVCAAQGVLPLQWIWRSVFAVGGLLVIAALLGAANPKPLLPTDPPSLAGQLLIASTENGDPRFYRTVIFVVRHNKDGAFGITINRPLGERSLANLLEILGEKDASAEGKLQIFAGGPVQLDAAIVLHTTDYNRSETIYINGRVAVTSTQEIFRDMAHNKGPRKTLVAFGYAGWAPGQLEAELARSAWFTGAADPQLIFDEPRERVWEEALAHRSRDL